MISGATGKIQRQKGKKEEEREEREERETKLKLQKVKLCETHSETVHAHLSSQLCLLKYVEIMFIMFIRLQNGSNRVSPCFTKNKKSKVESSINGPFLPTETACRAAQLIMQLLRVPPIRLDPERGPEVSVDK